jgi:LmbE family N-acetylglucosaminyl deacetylase
MDQLTPVPEDWQRALAVVAHPDDMEYGAASAVARWTLQGKHVHYVLVTEGEAGISDLSPAEVAPLRRAEQVASCAAVGVGEPEFLGYPDGLVVADLNLRRDLAAAIRRHVDHRNVGLALLDAVRDAANPWIFQDAGQAWPGVRFVAFSGSPQSTHGVDITDTIDAGVASLSCHRLYLEHLDEPVRPDAFLRTSAEATGPRLGVRLGTAFELIFP